jgi:hypothetical protein
MILCVSCVGGRWEARRLVSRGQKAEYRGRIKKDTRQ